jgi:hypothetical protein
MKLNTEYFLSPYYFYLKENEDKFIVYFSVSNTITEARKKDEKIEFPKTLSSKIKKRILKIIKDKNLNKSSDIKKELTKKDDKKEIDELVDFDGTLMNSKIPFINQKLAPHTTTDQVAITSMQPGNPVTRGYRVYYGESQDKNDDVIYEVDFSDAFGYEETKELDGKNTFKYLVKKMDMDPDEAKKRTKQFGKNPNKHKKTKNPKIIDKMTLKEMEKNKMLKMMEILLHKKNNDSEIVEKEREINNFLMKNLKSIKNIAKKEGISISQLIKVLKDE